MSRSSAGIVANELFLYFRERTRFSRMLIPLEIVGNIRDAGESSLAAVMVLLCVVCNMLVRRLSHSLVSRPALYLF